MRVSKETTLLNCKCNVTANIAKAAMDIHCGCSILMLYPLAGALWVTHVQCRLLIFPYEVRHLGNFAHFRCYKCSPTTGYIFARGVEGVTEARFL